MRPSERPTELPKCWCRPCEPSGQPPPRRCSRFRSRPPVVLSIFIIICRWSSSSLWATLFCCLAGCGRRALDFPFVVYIFDCTSPKYISHTAPWPDYVKGDSLLIILPSHLLFSSALRACVVSTVGPTIARCHDRLRYSDGVERLSNQGGTECRAICVTTAPTQRGDQTQETGRARAEGKRGTGQVAEKTL